jgi:hypothetical protein
MANTSVFTGADGSITLAPVTPGAEGEKAKGIVDSYFPNGSAVGRAQNVRVEVRAEVRPYHEIGARFATELRSGNVTIRGSIGRAYINGALLKLLLGDAATQLLGSWAQPAFNITLLAANAAAPDVTSTVTLQDVKFDSWVYDLPEDDFLMESVTFQARYLTVEDKP